MNDKVIKGNAVGDLIDYAGLYPGSELKNFDGAINISRGNIKYGDALAAISYVHGISYSQICTQWPEVTNNERWYGGTASEQLDFIKQNATRTPKNVLEIGSGRGEATGFLCELGYNVTSIEPSLDAKELHTTTHAQVFRKQFDYELLNSSIHTLDIDYSKFDTIILVESLEHILAEHWDPEWEKISTTFTGCVAFTNWLKYHPIAVGQYAKPEHHCRLVDDALYDSYADCGTTLYRDRSHLCVELNNT